MNGQIHCGKAALGLAPVPALAMLLLFAVWPPIIFIAILPVTAPFYWMFAIAAIGFAGVALWQRQWLFPLAALVIIALTLAPSPLIVYQ